MAEQYSEGSPLIDPAQVQPVLRAEVAPGTPAVQVKRKPTAAELGPKEYCWGIGRRKSAVARVRLRPGSGKLLVNDRELDNYFPSPQDQRDVRNVLEVTDRGNAYDIWANVQGGGTTGQAGALVLGIARALAQAEPELYVRLKDQQLLTRDSRKKERKKYGRAAARRSFQFSKR